MVLHHFSLSLGDDLPPFFPVSLESFFFVNGFGPGHPNKQHCSPTVQSAPKRAGTNHNMRRGTSPESMAELSTNGWGNKSLEGP